LLRLELKGPYKAEAAKSYQRVGVSQLDHEKITAEPEKRLCRSALGLTRQRNG